MNIYQRILAAVIIAAVPCGDSMVTLQAATLAAQSTYQSSAAPNPDEVRRVVINLGVGQHVAVKLVSGSSGRTMRGLIREIDADHFTLVSDPTGILSDIAYDNVRQLGPIPIPQWWKSSEKIIGIAAGISFFVLAFIECRNKSC